MPAAAVIPAPIAYIKVVAVKKLVVGFLVPLAAVRPYWSVYRSQAAILPGSASTLHWAGLRDLDRLL